MTVTTQLLGCPNIFANLNLHETQTQHSEHPKYPGHMGQSKRHQDHMAACETTIR